MKIYTRRGDDGETDLFGGTRVPKSDARVEAYGTVDELNAAVGLALALAEEWAAAGDEAAEPADGGAERSGEGLLDGGRLERVQDDLFAIGARLAADDPEEGREKGQIPDFPRGRVDELEGWIDGLEEELPRLDAFVLPGGHPVGAQLHVARTVCRRAERATVRLAGEEPDLREVALPYLNRLSDLLFVLARAVNRRAGHAEKQWEPVRRRSSPEEGEGR